MNSPVPVAVLAPLLELGWTFEDISKCTHAQLQVALHVLRRKKILEAGANLSEELIHEKPELIPAWNAYMDEREKLEKVNTDAGPGQSS